MDNNINNTTPGRIRKKVLGVPVDEVTLDSALKLLELYTQDNEKHQISLISVREILIARHDLEYNRMLKESSLVLPTAKGITVAARFLKAGSLTRVRPFAFLIRMLTLIERTNKTVYLLGAKKEDVEQAERNLKASFPDLRIVGRFSGFFTKEQERNILLAIRKASPSLLICGTGLGGREKWILRHKKDFNPGIYIWADNCFEIFSGKEKQPSKTLFALGLEQLTRLKKHPLKVFRIIPYLFFLLLLLIYRVFKL